jgi:predicted AlkP superfamily pyrophosphatase or phosphodiesterase
MSRDLFHFSCTEQSRDIMRKVCSLAFALVVISGCANIDTHRASTTPISATANNTANDGTAATKGPIVVLITLDGFPARALDDPRLPMPTLRVLEANGAHADGMKPINPTITWPNHTTLITGVNASEHHVMANGFITSSNGSTLEVDPWVPKDELVHARTLYDAAAEQGMSTGQVDWVAISDAKHVRWAFAEVPDADGPIAKDLIDQGLVTRDELADFHKSSPAWTDEIWTDAAIDILTRHTPNLLLFHLLQTDTLQHKYGTLTPAAYAAYAYADACLARFIDAARTAGLLDRITFIIASDHGFANYTHVIYPNAALVQMGLLHKKNGSYAGNVWFLPEGGETSLYINDPSLRSTLVPKLKRYFATVPGVAGAYTNEEAQAFGIASRQATRQGPDLYVVAKPDYAFMGGTDEPMVQDIAPARGSHGYLNSNPDMEALFIAYGAHIRHGVDLGPITNLAVAPTIAKLLGVSLPAAKQAPLSQMLQ